MARIGNRDSALARLAQFIARVDAYLGRRPAVIVLFAEDYDAIADVAAKVEAKQRVRLERGPSVREYA